MVLLLFLSNEEMMRGRKYASLNDTKKVIAALEDAVDVYRNEWCGRCT